MENYNKNKTLQEIVISVLILLFLNYLSTKYLASFDMLKIIGILFFIRLTRSLFLFIKYSVAPLLGFNTQIKILSEAEKDKRKRQEKLGNRVGLVILVLLIIVTIIIVTLNLTHQ